MSDWDELSGRRDPEQKYRIYRVADGGKPELIATCGSAEAVGVAIVTLGGEGEFDDYACGVLDSMPECPACDGDGRRRVDGSVTLYPCLECKGSGDKQTGSWILKPWAASPTNVSAAARVLRSVRPPIKESVPGGLEPIPRIAGPLQAASSGDGAGTDGSSPAKEPRCVK